jgi:hypothetical protein
MDKRKNNGGHSTSGKAGRPALKVELKGVELASPHVQESFEVLANIMKDCTENSRDRIAAAKLLIEYGCGKPDATINNKVTLTDLNIKEIVNFK